MSTTVEVLLAVAKELAKQAEDSMPKIQEGEKILREWYSEGKYFREASLNGKTSVHLYDFGQRKSRLLAAGVLD